MDVRLTDRQRARLRREAAGDRQDLLQLTAEAIARAWLLDRGVPCWSSPDRPGAAGRFGLVMRDGTRVLVSADTRSAGDLDTMAAARCSYLLLVELDGLGGGRPAAFRRLVDIGTEAPPGSPDELPGLLGRPRRFRLSMIAGTARLLLLGCRNAPPPVIDDRWDLPLHTRR